MAKVTFIIPTVGRETLDLTITSLIEQTNPNWNAIIVFDGIEPNIKCVDPRIKIMQCEKIGEGVNSAGNVRNYAVQHVETEWIAFVDDDDTVSNDYVECLFEEAAKNLELDVIVFRMIYKNNMILPPLDCTTLILCSVGISFSLKTKIMKEDNILFIPSNCEDFNLLDRIRENNYKMIIHPCSKYFVRSIPRPVGEEGVRANINF